MAAEMTRNEMLSALREYATLSKRLDDTGEGLLSALVNLVDTARENPTIFSRAGCGLQVDRERAIVRFVLDHCASVPLPRKPTRKS